MWPQLVVALALFIWAIHVTGRYVRRPASFPLLTLGLTYLLRRFLKGARVWGLYSGLLLGFFRCFYLWWQDFNALPAPSFFNLSRLFFLLLGTFLFCLRLFLLRL